jgi:hypothetical protein
VATRFANPAGRVAGAAASWLLFAFVLTGLLLASATVIGLGGACASGGPYVSATPCPGSVLVFAPLGVFGTLAAVGISGTLAQDFAAPLYAWFWPLLFTGLGIVFLLGAVSGFGIVSNLLVAILSLAMGLGPLVLGLRAGGLRTLLVGSRTVHGEPFDKPDARTVLLRARTAGTGNAVPITAGRAALAVGIPFVSAAAGVVLAQLAVRALG